MARSKKKSRRKPAGIVLAVLGGLVVVAVLGLAALVRLTEASLPPVPSWEEYADSVPKVSRILAADGSVIREIYTERRTLIAPDNLPPLLVNAVLAAEDAGFMEHDGLSYAGIARAMAKNIVKGRISQGGSTISQQVVKQVLLTPERTLVRKFKELLLTRQLEMKLGKKEILAIYLSHTYLGSGRYGFEEASRFLFGKPAADLLVEEAAMLGGLVSAPEGNSMLKNPEGAVTRQIHVLNRMAELDMITADQAAVASEARLKVVARDTPGLGTAPYFADAVARELRRLAGTALLEKGGLTVRTTLDPVVSAAAEHAVTEGLVRLYQSGRKRIEDEHGGMAGAEDLGLDEEAASTSRMPVARVAGCRRGDSQAFVSADGKMSVVANSSLSRLGGSGRERLDAFCDGLDLVAVSKGVRQVDTVHGRLEEVNAELGPQASFVVIEASSRAVLAMVGGEDFDSRPYNRAIQASMPIGSTIKPFIYAAALTAGIREDEGWVNEPVAFRGHGGKTWKPRNYGGVYDGRTYDMTAAIKDSVNVIAVKVLKQTGVEKVAELLESVGFRGHIPRDLSMALGSVEASPLELANAYAVFASAGRLDTPWFIHDVRDWRGKSILGHENRPGRVMSAQVASAIRRMLREVVVDGTASDLNMPDKAIWGKTGTTNKSREAWFAGGFDDLVGVVLVAYDDRISMKGATGGNTAVPLFKLFVERYLARVK